MWVIKINRVFLTDLLSSSELRLGLPSVRQANTRAAAECSPVCALPARAPVPEVVGGLEGAGGEVSVCGHSPMTFTGRTPNGGLPGAWGRRRRIKRALPTLIWGPWPLPTLHNFCGPTSPHGFSIPLLAPASGHPTPCPCPRDGTGEVTLCLSTAQAVQAAGPSLSHSAGGYPVAPQRALSGLWKPPPCSHTQAAISRAT